jgi:hypothetical protein
MTCDVHPNTSHLAQGDRDVEIRKRFANSLSHNRGRVPKPNTTELDWTNTRHEHHARSINHYRNILLGRRPPNSQVNLISRTKHIIVRHSRQGWGLKQWRKVIGKIESEPTKLKASHVLHIQLKLRWPVKSLGDQSHLIELRLEVRRLG